MAKPIVEKMNKRSRNRASAIIPYNDGIIVIQRIKGMGEERQVYYTIPGGGQEEGETIEQATIREVKEELGINIKLTNDVYIINSYGMMQFFYVAEYVDGEMGTGQGPEMINTDYDKYGLYNPMVVKKEDIRNINLMPSEIKEIILRDIEKIGISVGMPVEVSSMGIVIGEKQGVKKVLLLRDDEGSWVFPKGHVKEGETDMQAAIRELVEETRIEVHPRQCIGKVHEFGFTFERKGVYKHINVFLFKVNSFEIINKEKDFMDAQWIDLPKAIQILQHDDAKNALNKAIEVLDRENEKGD